MSHVPVLLKEVIGAIAPEPGEFMMDGTLGSGGHAKALLDKLGSRGTLLAVDWDEKNLERFRKENENTRGNLVLVHGNYANLSDILEKHRLPKADGLLLDLGFSNEQLEHSGRGFSFNPPAGEETLDMRYDAGNDEMPTAANIVNSFPEKELADIIYEYGEEKFSRRIAKAIAESRKRGRITTSRELANVITKAVPRNYEHGRIHPATRTFQALRIYVNDELGNLKTILGKLTELVDRDGRIAIISFHSLEDRLVKISFQNLVKNKKASFINKKPVTAGREEKKNNPRSRSAKLRAVRIL
jgi:16S rRNA (cytosine1402-N4)-methyltransferase